MRLILQISSAWERAVDKYPVRFDSCKDDACYVFTDGGDMINERTIRIPCNSKNIYAFTPSHACKPEHPPDNHPSHYDQKHRSVPVNNEAVIPTVKGNSNYYTLQNNREQR